MAQYEIPYAGPDFKQKLLHWAAQFPYCVFLDSCDAVTDKYGNYDWLLGMAFSSHAASVETLDALQDSVTAHPFDWRFGIFSYDLKNELEPKLQTQLSASIPFPQLNFFIPDVVAYKPRGRHVIIFEKGFSQSLYDVIAEQKIPVAQVRGFSGFKSNFRKSEYTETIQKLRNHIREGDCYEINLSQNFSANAELHSPVALWEALISVSPAPFAGYARFGPIHLLCASPERFLQLRSGRLLTQPIKGTAPRGPDMETDRLFAAELRASKKEQAENVMIVDLSRNDLYKSCEVNSVKVPHLLEVQSFPQVHHLVSTITGQKRKDVHPITAFRNTFPAGSMTGAPKFRSSELIDKYERSARGIYAGALGYFAPGGDFDLNVIIRSLVYDSQKGQISYHVGGAITWDSDPVSEYEETLVKAKAIEALFKKFG